MVNEEVPREALALCMATRHLGVTVVGEGREASVTAKRHAKGGEHALVARPPFFHRGHNVGFIAPLLQFGDDSHDGDLWGHLVPDAQYGFVRLSHAPRDSRNAAHAHDEEVHTAFLAELPEERPQRMLRSPGGDVPKRALAQPRCVPQTKRVRAGPRFPSVSARTGGDATDIVCGGRAVCAGDEVDEGAFTDAGFTCDDDVAGDEA